MHLSPQRGRWLSAALAVALSLGLRPACAVEAAMPRDMLVKVQGLLASPSGAQWTALAPSLNSIAKMSPESPVHLEALGALSFALSPNGVIEENLADPAARQALAARILAANHTAAHAARVEAVLEKRLDEISRSEEDERAASLVELDPLIQLGYAFKSARSAPLLKRAQRLADELGVSGQLSANRDFVDAASLSALKGTWKPVLSVRPLQKNAGMREVSGKTRALQALSPQQLKDFILTKPIPVVVREKKKIRDFSYDHHHTLLAAWTAGVEVVPVDAKETVKVKFWRRMKEQKMVWLRDADGRKIRPGDLPRDVRGLGDDIYRSLAGRVRDLGGYAKSSKPAAEFYWALFFLENLRTRPEENFERAVKETLELAKDPRAKDLPGYIGRRKE